MKPGLKTKTPEILNQELKDLPNERWEDIPMLDGIARISNYGRVKRMEHEVTDSRGITYILKERIQKIKVHRYYNRSLKEDSYHIGTRINVQNKNYLITIGRMVYYCFVEHFDITDKSIIIIPVDHNGLNMKPENLIKVNHEGFQKHIRSNNRRDPDFWKHNKMEVPFFTIGQKSHEKEVSRYNTEGILIATYDSIVNAANEMKVGDSAISRVITGEGLTCCGYIWQLGKDPVVSKTILEKIQKKKSKMVTQYDLKGNKLQTFLNVNVAAKAIGSNRTSISNAVKGKYRKAAGYLWMYSDKNL